MNSYSRIQTLWLVTLRLLIGWHFLYEGLAKVFNSKWSALPYLADSQGWFAFIFHKMAANPEVIDIVNFLNAWGLVLIGLGLIVGCFTRFAILGGIILLVFYYLSHPPFIGAEYMLPSEGSYLWIDKNVVEMAALALLYVFPTSHIFGFDRYICMFLSKIKQKR